MRKIYELDQIFPYLLLSKYVNTSSQLPIM